MGDCFQALSRKHNYTLMTLEILKSYRVPILGLIFNGSPCLDSEEAILTISRLPVVGRLLPERSFHRNLIQKYAEQWLPCLTSL